MKVALVLVRFAAWLLLVYSLYIFFATAMTIGFEFGDVTEQNKVIPEAERPRHNRWVRSARIGLPLSLLILGGTYVLSTSRCGRNLQ